MELVDVVDSKSTAGDSVPVRVRSPAPARRKRHIACDELFHFIAKLIARSFCCSSLPNRTRFTGLRFGAAAARRFCQPLKNINFDRPFHVGAKSALLRRLFMPAAQKDVIRPLPCSSFPNRTRCAGLRFGFYFAIVLESPSHPSVRGILSYGKETGRESIRWDIPAAAKVPCFASQTAKKSGASDTRRRRRGWNRRGLR